MINPQIEIIIRESLENYLGCPVILANQHAPAPAYPYCTYHLVTPIETNHGTYGTEYDGIFYKPVRQVWSITVQSDDDTQCSYLISKAFDWFSLVGLTFLYDNKIAVERLENISNRDNLITIQYEYRRGFDVTFVVDDEINMEFETIENVHLGKERETEVLNEIDLVDEMLEIEHETDDVTDYIGKTEITKSNEKEQIDEMLEVSKE